MRVAPSLVEMSGDVISARPTGGVSPHSQFYLNQKCLLPCRISIRKGLTFEIQHPKIYMGSLLFFVFYVHFVVFFATKGT
jgi:hypothetical protein